MWYDEYKLKVRHLISVKLFNKLERYYMLGKVEVACMTKERELTEIVKSLSKLGVKATATKSRLELLKVLTPPTQTPHAQNV